MISLTYVEIDVDYCSLQYGVAPCTAAIGVTGTAKCFNSLGSCQDRPHFTKLPTTLRFAMDTTDLPDDIECVPSVMSISISPGIVSLGQDLGQRASVKVMFSDHRHSDTGVGGDPYLSERPYDPFKMGTFWGKFRARHPYLRGRALRIIRGSLGQTLAQMETEHYIIDSTDGPGVDGVYTINARDVLKLADGDRAQAPRLSNGYLLNDISDSDTAATLAPAGIGNEEYPSAGYIAIGGREICVFTRTGDSLDLSRGQLGTEPQSHDAQDRVQACLYYEGGNAADIINGLLTMAGVPSSYIPIADWVAETTSYLRNVYTAIIAEPTPIDDLLSELVEQAALALWWDPITRLVRLQVLRGIPSDVGVFGSDEIVEGTLQTQEQPDTRVSRIWTYFGQINPLGGQTDPYNYRSAALTIDGTAETDFGSPAIKKIFSRWIPAFGRSTALRLNDIQLGRFKIPPRRIKFALSRADHDEVVLGGGYKVQNWNLQDSTGAPVLVPVQVTRLGRSADQLSIEAEELRFTDLSPPPVGERTITIDTDYMNLNIRNVHDTLFPSPVSGDEITVYIETNVTIYSRQASLPALNVGVWPVGVIIKIYHRGVIRAAGGMGGRGWTPDSAPTDGEQGGTAIYSRYPVQIDFDPLSFVLAGGGGGGGGNVNTLNPSDDRGGGGGGGAGRRGGAGGEGPSPATNGSLGGNDAPGIGGQAFSTLNWWETNYLTDIRGGTGGYPGDPGQQGQGWGGSVGASGGPGGYAIDGVSNLTITGVGVRLGAEVN